MLKGIRSLYEKTMLKMSLRFSKPSEETEMLLAAINAVAISSTPWELERMNRLIESAPISSKDKARATAKLKEEILAIKTNIFKQRMAEILLGTEPIDFDYVAENSMGARTKLPTKQQMFANQNTQMKQQLMQQLGMQNSQGLQNQGLQNATGILGPYHP